MQPNYKLITVKQITPVVLGRELFERCGDEDQQIYINKQKKATLKLLKHGISFIPQALDAKIDLKNASFIFAQPGREFVVRAGNGDWEICFLEQMDGTVCGRCTRYGSHLRWMWDSAAGTFVRDTVSSLCYDVILPFIKKSCDPFKMLTQS